jgi:hypothetical protein
MSDNEFSFDVLEKRMPGDVARSLCALQPGTIADGFLHIVTPDLLDDTLAEWLGGFDPTRTPFARTALGDMIYVRDLRQRARDLGLDAETAETAHDVSLVDVRYKQTRLLAMSFDEFAPNLSDPAWLESELRIRTTSSGTRRTSRWPFCSRCDPTPPALIDPARHLAVADGRLATGLGTGRLDGVP